MRAVPIVLNALLGVLLYGTGAAAEPPVSLEEQAIFDFTNAERKKAGLTELAPDPLLNKIAQQHSANMARKNTLAHELNGKSVADRAKDAGYKYFLIEENVAWNQRGPAEVVKAWMDSPHHRENLLAPKVTQLGVGVARNKKGEPYYTQVFGRPETAGPTSSATFRVRNQTRAQVVASISGSLKPAQIPPGATLVINVFGMDKLPPWRLEADNFAKEYPSENGATFVARPGAGGIEVRKLEAEHAAGDVERPAR